MEAEIMNECKTYSDAKKRLEEIAKSLESSDITLEKSMELYEEGAALRSAPVFLAYISFMVSRSGSLPSVSRSMT